MMQAPDRDDSVKGAVVVRELESARLAHAFPAVEAFETQAFLHHLHRAHGNIYAVVDGSGPGDLLTDGAEAEADLEDRLVFAAHRARDRGEGRGTSPCRRRRNGFRDSRSMRSIPCDRASVEPQSSSQNEAFLGIDCDPDPGCPAPPAGTIPQAMRRILILHYTPHPRAVRLTTQQHLDAVTNLPGSDVLSYNAVNGAPAWLRHLRFDAVVLHTTLLCMRWNVWF